MKTAVITGVSGQDGAYLSRLLLEKGYVVIGVTRSINNASKQNLKALKISKDIQLVEADLADFRQCVRLLQEHRPHEVYNLAAQSSVSYSFEQPLETIQFNFISVVNLLEAIRKVNKRIKFYQASSSEMYGQVNELPVKIDSVLHPVSPYGISKASGHWLVSQYRESYNLFSVSGVLFNHESFLRSESFFVKKVVSAAIRMKHGSSENLHVGNIDVKRDFGNARDYVKAIWLMMQQEEPKDYLVCSGSSVSLREVIYYVFDQCNLDRSRVIVEQALKRPSEIADIYGDPTLAQDELQWYCETSFFKVLDELLEQEEKLIGKYDA